MKAYSKKEPKFTKAQLIFVVDVMITSAIDAVDASFPCNKSSHDIPKIIFDGIVNGVIEKLGFDLSIFYAQITGDGIGCCDVMEMTKMDCYLDVEKKKKVNTDKIATKFVDELFKDYLSDGVSSLDHNLIMHPVKRG